MKVLAVDTTSLTATVAVVDEGKLLGENTINNKLTHSQTMMPMIEQLLSGLELTVDDIDGFAVSAGPGSFTGIRIGISSLSALAYTVKKPIVGVPTLDVLAMNARFSTGLVVAMINARNHQVYAGTYTFNNLEQTKISDYVADDLNEVLNQVVNLSNEHNINHITFVGDGACVYSDDILEFFNKYNFKVTISDEIDSNLSAKWVAFIGGNLLEESFSSECDMNNFIVEPIYLRKSQAERLLEEHKK